MATQDSKTPSDRELLEMAAKAAGIALCKEPVFANALTQQASDNEAQPWNPLTRDGDALRLVVILSINLILCKVMHTTEAWGNIADSSTGVCERHNRDAGAATRRAIVRAAAEIGAAL